MKAVPVDPKRIRGAWQGRVSECQLGKPVELLSMKQGREALNAYLKQAGALPLRDYIPLLEGTVVELTGRRSCKGNLQRNEPDDDITYTVLALRMLEQRGLELTTADVDRCPDPGRPLRLGLPRPPRAGSGACPP
jgi:hypothetical protein